MDTNQTKKALSILKAIAYTENGGQPNISKSKAGKSGEMKSVLQFLPATWKEYSKQVTGKDGLPLNPETEMTVGYHKVDNWLSDGYTPEQIFSMWNSGKPNAYRNNVKGINKNGVSFDTPSYVKKATNYLNEFEGNNLQTKGALNEGKPAVNKKQEGLLQTNIPQSEKGLYQLP